MADHPSPFYSLVEPATQFTLQFPYVHDIDIYERDLHQVGAASPREIVEEPVMLVPLGQDRYRLAERLDGAFSELFMHWGDEFIAEDSGPGSLTFLRMVAPRKFVHFRFITSPGFRSETRVIGHIHRCGGGWETVAGGMLTMTIPVEKEQEFIAAMELEKLWPVGVSVG
jgi:hypothetical protein